ncbi:MAG: hypothetical protein PHV16_01530 [Candidatus Nanoarchaeia archaeon]|nr:hypothetical protein [Candidatus Nanoarchaeia archaeon]
MKLQNTIFYFLCLIVFASFIFLGASIASFDVLGANNSIVTTRVNITNTEPDVHYVFITPDPVDLTPGETTTVNCTGYVYDLDGYADVQSANATFYDSSIGDTGGFDGTSRYYNSSCACSEISAFNASCSCTFEVQYYANNGTWQCNMTAVDGEGVSDNENSSLYDVNTVIGIDVPTEIDYGNLSVTDYSLEKQLQITNYGNVPINVSVRGYGGTINPYNPDNLAMECAYGGNISIEYEKYSLTPGLGYESMVALSNSSSEMNLEVQVKTSDISSNNYNTTYWMIYIPSGVGGICNGTLHFVGHENPQ